MKEVVQITPKDRISEHLLEQIVDMPVPQVAAEIVEVIKDKDTPQERIKSLRVSSVLAQPPSDLGEDRPGHRRPVL